MKSFRCRRMLFPALGAALCSVVQAAEPAPPPPTGRDVDAKTSAIAMKVDLNTADAAVLEKMPEIGPEFASAIVAARPYKTIDDLLRVPGFGVERITRLRGKVMLSPVKPSAAKPEPGRADEPSIPKSPARVGPETPKASSLPKP